MCENKMTLSFLAVSENESFARSAVAAFCLGLNPTIEEIGDIKTAVSEAVTNSIVHGYGNSGKGFVTITVAVNGETVTIKIADEGKGIDDVSKAMQPFFTSGDIEERSGMGFTVMQAMMDEVNVESQPKSGTTVFMKKIIGSGVRDA
ncbi:MAG TPA: anti-sigma F factor [Eubacteriales bacterium]|nr:anti-sigma F factor [Eubacteriales bacterium]